ncbi:MAG: hypothetical protein M3Q40_10435 [Pseudomonadota bacterium]|nr:hypothetical protein [Pseudomonadota bacterium]
MRQLLLSLTSACLLALCACAGPATAEAEAEAVEAVQADLAQQSAPAPARTAPPMSDPLPPVEAVSPDAAARGASDSVVDFSCRTSDDCAIKDIGSCCGARPACVNAGSPADPEAVQAACAESGMVSTCGFPAISSCQCVQGTCEGNSGAVLQ